MKTTDRKFDTWEWRDDSTAPKAIQFEVRCERPINVAEGPLRYYIKHDEPPISVEANDLGPLRDRLDAAVRAFYAVVWEPVLVVHVTKKSPSRATDAIGFELELHAQEYERGVFNGEPIHRRRRPQPGGAFNYAYALKPGDIAREFRRFNDEQPVAQFAIADTPDNRAALETFDTMASDLLTSVVNALKARDIAR